MPRKCKKAVPDSQKIYGKYAMIPLATVNSPEYIALQPSEKLIFNCLIMHWIRNGKNDNTITVSIQFIVDHTGLDRTTVWRGLRVLRDKKFIDYISIKNITTTYKLNPKYTTDIRRCIDDW